MEALVALVGAVAARVIGARHGRRAMMWALFIAFFGGAAFVRWTTGVPPLFAIVLGTALCWSLFWWPFPTLESVSARERLAGTQPTRRPS